MPGWQDGIPLQYFSSRLPEVVRSLRHGTAVTSFRAEGDDTAEARRLVQGNDLVAGACRTSDASPMSDRGGRTANWHS